MLSPHMKHHYIAVVEAERMAIHTIAITHIIDHHGLFRVIFKASLINSHLAPCFKSRFYKTIYQVVIDILVCYMVDYCIVLKPFSVLFCIYLCKQIIAPALLKQFFPFPSGNDYFSIS